MNRGPSFRICRQDSPGAGATMGAGAAAPSDAAEERAESEPPASPAVAQRGHERRDPPSAAEAMPVVAPAQARAVVSQQLGEERAVVVAESRQCRRILQPRRVKFAVATPLAAEAAVKRRCQRAPCAPPLVRADVGEALRMLAIDLEALVEISDAAERRGHERQPAIVERLVCWDRQGVADELTPEEPGVADHPIPPHQRAR